MLSPGHYERALKHAILLEKSDAYIIFYCYVRYATQCHITYQALYCLAFSYDDVMEGVAVPIPGAVAHASRESLIAVRIPLHQARGFNRK
jgi:hypothetical protein